MPDELTPEQRAVADQIMADATDEMIESIRHFVVDHMTPLRDRFRATRSHDDTAAFQFGLAIALGELNARVSQSALRAQKRMEDAGLPGPSPEDEAKAKALADRIAGAVSQPEEPVKLRGPIMPGATD